MSSRDRDSVINAFSGLAFPFLAIAASACLHLPCYLPPADETCLCVYCLWACICEQGSVFWALILNKMENILNTASASCLSRGDKVHFIFLSHEKKWAALVDMLGLCHTMLFFSTEILTFGDSIILYCFVSIFKNLIFESLVSWARD